MQINNFIDKNLSKFMCGYRKGYNPQHVILTLTEKSKKILDNNEYSGVECMDLSTVIYHDLLIFMHMVLTMLLWNQ